VGGVGGREEADQTEDQSMIGYVLTVILLIAARVMPLGSSECFGIDARTTKQRAALVFEGTITKAEELGSDEIEITMDVHRVWKGDVSKRATVYYPAGPLWGSPESSPRPTTTWLKAGERFVVFTNAAFEGRPRLAEHRTSWIAPCYGFKRPDADVIKQLGRSRKPKETS
jgi:hypothetical protein